MFYCCLLFICVYIADAKKWNDIWINYAFFLILFIYINYIPIFFFYFFKFILSFTYIFGLDYIIIICLFHSNIYIWSIKIINTTGFWYIFLFVFETDSFYNLNLLNILLVFFRLSIGLFNLLIGYLMSVRFFAQFDLVVDFIYKIK